MAKVSLQGRGSVDETVNLLKREIQNSGLSCTLVDSVERNTGSATLYVMVFEKYYMRTSNRASLTVVVSGENDFVYVDAIGAGGGQGAIFRFSWGAEDDFAGTVTRILKPHGFQ